MATYPLATLAPTIDASGISAPPYSDIYKSLLATFRSIYGQDIYVAPDSQDGQWIAVLAKVIDDSNQAAVTLFQSFSPTYAQGAELASLVKINGITKKVPTNSEAIGLAIGQAGSLITNGVVRDVSGNLWNLPASVTIPVSGEIEVTVVAQETGAINAAPNAINVIQNPQFGWQSFSNTFAATPGAPVESDTQLRARQTISTSLPALAILEAISAAIGAVPDVTRFLVYENDTSTANPDGIPAHTICAVVSGGDVASVTAAIYSRKPPGIQTYGAVSGTVYDRYGLPTVINYAPLDEVPIFFSISLKALQGYVSTTADAIRQALVSFLNALQIGTDVYASQCLAVAGLPGQTGSDTFYITDFLLGVTASPSGTGNITITFDQAATCEVANIAILVS
jgi:uncharacterized phage protein gp47/JayE